MLAPRSRTGDSARNGNLNSLGAQNGLSVKDRLALERARNLDIAFAIRTGTLTRGSPGSVGSRRLHPALPKMI